MPHGVAFIQIQSLLPCSTARTKSPPIAAHTIIVQSQARTDSLPNCLRERKAPVRGLHWIRLSHEHAIPTRYGAAIPTSFTCVSTGADYSPSGLGVATPLPERWLLYSTASPTSGRTVKLIGEATVCRRKAKVNSTACSATANGGQRRRAVNEGIWGRFHRRLILLPVYNAGWVFSPPTAKTPWIEKLEVVVRSSGELPVILCVEECCHTYLRGISHERASLCVRH